MDKLAEDMILLGQYSYPEDIVGTASAFIHPGPTVSEAVGETIMAAGGRDLH